MLESYIWLIAAGVGVIVSYLIIKSHIEIYNKFQYWIKYGSLKSGIVKAILRKYT